VACGTRATSPAGPTNGGFVITGRSDATLNPGRIRIGSGEIYQVLQRVPDVVDSLVIAQ
jgi:acetoacetyl-CoA synthetase